MPEVWLRLKLLVCGLINTTRSLTSVSYTVVEGSTSAYSVHQHSTGYLQHNRSQLLPSLLHFQRQVDAELQHEGRRRRRKRSTHLVEGKGEVWEKRILRRKGFKDTDKGLVEEEETKEQPLTYHVYLKATHTDIN